MYWAAFVSMGHAVVHGDTGASPAAPLWQVSHFLSVVFKTNLTDADALKAYPYGLSEKAFDMPERNPDDKNYQEDAEYYVGATVFHFSHAGWKPALQSCRLEGPVEKVSNR